MKTQKESLAIIKYILIKAMQNSSRSVMLTSNALGYLGEGECGGERLVIDINMAICCIDNANIESKERCSQLAEIFNLLEELQGQ